MNPVNLLMLLTLAALWGGSFLFMRVAGPVLGPFMTIELRVGIAAIALFLYAATVKHRFNIRQKWKEFLVIGAINAAIPFVLITTAELSLSSSLASILNATTPIFTAIIARFWLKEGFGPQKILGLLAGVIGVMILVGWDPVPLTGKVLLSVSFSLIAAFFYGVAGIFSAKYLKGIKPIDLAIGQQTAAAILLIPFAATNTPAVAPSATVIYAVLGLALFSTACGYLLY
ncbi:MAG TPA: EamA family transporter, partial [Verrucomicrobiae bacterium]|nr:EamA family transporter [Verrucomicrobiae bacterium]